MSRKKILIAAGGTGGHIFPAQGLAEQLVARLPTSKILFAAGGLGSNRYFDRTLFPYKEVVCSPLLSRNPFKLMKGLYHLFKGTQQACQVLKEFDPDIIVAFGSYYTVSMLLAAKIKKVPYIIHEANSFPGKANKWLAPYAKAIGVHFPATISLLRGNVSEVGMPLRADFALEKITREEALAYYGLKAELPVLLIFGGSQGARALNGLIEKCILPSLQVIHITGNSELDQLANYYQSQQIRAILLPFEKKMQMAWRCADLFIGRSGAATIAEALEFEVPGILIPYPYATDDHQNTNADFLVKTVGSAIKFQEADLTPANLTIAVKQVIEERSIMKAKAKVYKQRASKMNLCDLVLKHLNTVI